MILPIFAVACSAFCVSVAVCFVVLRISRRLGVEDSSGRAGQVKAAPRRVPNTGGIGIMAGITAVVLIGLALARLPESTLPALLEPLSAHQSSLTSLTPMILAGLGILLVIHVLGLIDDRRALGPWSKLGVMVAVAAAVPTLFDTRLFEFLDAFPMGYAASVGLTILWIVVVTNAMNFLDNMDGLAGGVGAIATLALLVISLLNGQWFVAAALAALLGSIAGFLVYNIHPARLFMGDGGSLVIGLLLGVLTIRVTYISQDGSAWTAVFLPLVVLAVPLYDFVSVVLIRLAQGKSPFVGDLQHFSHRLVKRGLSVRSAALVLWAISCAAACAGVVLPFIPDWAAIVIGVQVFCLMSTIALLEGKTSAKNGADRS